MNRQGDQKGEDSGKKNLLVYDSSFLFIKALVFLFAAVLFAGPALAQESPSGPQKELSADDVAKELANPNTPLASLTLKTQYRTYTGDLRGADHQDNFSFLFQPVFPFPIAHTKTSDGEILDQIFFRPAFPILIDQPVFDANRGGFRGKSGLGDIGFDLAWGRNYPSGLLVAAGLVSSVPTGKKELSTRTWTLGPEVFIGMFQKWGVVGIFPSHQWNIGGPDDRPTSLTSIQPFAVFLLGGGWTAGTAGTLTYDWKASQWTIPLQAQVSKTVILGKMPVKLAFEANYYVERPDAFGPKWMFGFNITPVVPNVFAKWLGLAN